MPYKIERLPHSRFRVINEESGEVLAKNTTLTKAKAQIRLLEDAEGNNQTGGATNSQRGEAARMRTWINENIGVPKYKDLFKELSLIVHSGDKGIKNRFTKGSILASAVLSKARTNLEKQKQLKSSGVKIPSRRLKGGRVDTKKQEDIQRVINQRPNPATTSIEEVQQEAIEEENDTMDWREETGDALVNSWWWGDIDNETREFITGVADEGHLGINGIIEQANRTPSSWYQQQELNDVLMLLGYPIIPMNRFTNTIEPRDDDRIDFRDMLNRVGLLQNVREVVGRPNYLPLQEFEEPSEEFWEEHAPYQDIEYDINSLDNDPLNSTLGKRIKDDEEQREYAASRRRRMRDGSIVPVRDDERVPFDEMYYSDDNVAESKTEDLDNLQDSKEEYFGAPRTPDMEGSGLQLWGGEMSAPTIKHFLDASYQKKPPNEIDGFIQDHSLTGQRVQVYYNPTTKQAVVVHRGSSGIHDWGNNLKYSLGFNMGNTDRDKFAKKVQQQAERKYGAKNISTLGHSAGGRIASNVGENTKEIITLNRAVAGRDIFKKNNGKKENEFTLKTENDPVSIFNRDDENTFTIPSATINPLVEHSPDTINRMDKDKMIGKGLALPEIIKGLSGLNKKQLKEIIKAMPKINDKFRLVGSGKPKLIDYISCRCEGK